MALAQVGHFLGHDGKLVGGGLRLALRQQFSRAKVFDGHGVFGIRLQILFADLSGLIDLAVSHKKFVLKQKNLRRVEPQLGVHFIHHLKRIGILALGLIGRENEDVGFKGIGNSGKRPFGFDETSLPIRLFGGNLGGNERRLTIVRSTGERRQDVLAGPGAVTLAPAVEGPLRVDSRARRLRGQPRRHPIISSARVGKPTSERRRARRP